MPLPEEQVVTQHMGEPVHITITRNAKGDIQWEVSLHAPTTQAAVDNAIALSFLAVDKLNERFPKGGETK